jgi:hypothetical protein
MKSLNREMINKVTWFSNVSPNFYDNLDISPSGKLIDSFNHFFKFQSLTSPQIPKLSGTKGYKEVCVLEKLQKDIFFSGIDYCRIVDFEDLKKLEVTERILEEF